MSFSKLFRAIIVIMWAIYWIFFGIPVGAQQADQPPAQENAGTDKPKITLSGEGEKITVRAVGASLVDIVRMLADHAGMNVVIDPAISGTVTASFKDINLERALAVILEANGYAIHRHDGLARVLKAELASRQFTLNATPVGDLIEQLQQFLSAEGKVIANPQTNSFVVIDRPEVLANVESFLDLADLRERQVTIKAQLLEVSLDRHDQFGVKWDWLDTSMLSIHDITGSITQEHLLTPATGAFQVALGNEHFNSVFEALQTNGYMDLLSAPTITTVSNQEAKVEITEQLPYIESTTSIESSGGGAATTSTESVEFVDVGVKLSVLPQIGEDDKIRMKITPEVSEAPTRYEGVPVVKTRKAEAIVLVDDGQTIVLGGLIRNNITDERKGVPILSSIPLIGALFTHKDKRIVKVELLIVITPRIVDSALADADAEEGRRRISEKREAFR